MAALAAEAELGATAAAAVERAGTGRRRRHGNAQSYRVDRLPRSGLSVDPDLLHQPVTRQADHQGTAAGRRVRVIPHRGLHASRIDHRHARDKWGLRAGNWCWVWLGEKGAAR